MAGPLHIDPALVLSIAAKCRASSETLNGEATNMRNQMSSLRDALQGFPRLAMADQFDQLNTTFSQLAGQLDQANTYLNRVDQAVQAFVAQLGQG